MEDWNFGHYLIIIFMGTLTFAAIKIAHDSDKKKRAESNRDADQHFKETNGCNAGSRQTRESTAGTRHYAH